MDSFHWQVPGNGNPFDSDLKDWKNSKMSERSIGVLKFINDRERISKHNFENEIWNYLTTNFNHIKNNSNIGHFYRPLEFAGLIRRSKNNILDLSIDGRNFLKYLDKGDYDRAKDFYILQLLKVKYPNSATPNIKLYLFPFRIIFKLLLEYKSIDINFFSNEINYISKESDIYSLFEEYSDAYLSGLKFGGNVKWKSWVISYLLKWDILSIDSKNRVSISENKKEFIKRTMSNYEYKDMFFTDENDQIEKTLKTSVKVYRDHSIAKASLEQYKYKCFINENHNTFPTRQTNNYVEAHHIIPISLQDSWEEKLDSTENLIPLCPNCHRAIHLSTNEYKAKLLKSVYDKKEELHQYIKTVRYEDLLEIYCSSF